MKFCDGFWLAIKYMQTREKLFNLRSKQPSRREGRSWLDRETQGYIHPVEECALGRNVA